jgi:serine phosphatase RsbU (regulator of sigma subunit)
MFTLRDSADDTFCKRSRPWIGHAIAIQTRICNGFLTALQLPGGAPRRHESALRSVQTKVRSWLDRLSRIPPRVVDVGLAVVVAIAVTFAISVASEPGTHPPDAFAYALGLVIAAFVLVRRSWPVGVLFASVITLQIYYSLDYPGILPGVALAVALYSAASAGQLRRSLTAAAWFWVIPLFFAAFGVLGPRVEIFNQLVRDGAIMLAAILFGDAVRSHTALMAAASERIRRAEEDRKRDERELKAAQVIQQQLLPKELPSLPGWHVATCYQPARAVGGDFYDFLELPDGRVAFVTGDATDKGIPAALVMATTHSILRADGPVLMTPAAVLRRANERLVPVIPESMFVTCLYAVLDPTTGRLRFANAGHNLPYLLNAEGVTKLRATGLPLGALPDVTYEEKDVYIAPGDSVLLSSDGLVEAHNTYGAMFGFSRLQNVVASSNGGRHLIGDCLAALHRFVGSDWEQEDDITLVALQRSDPLT